MEGVMPSRDNNLVDTIIYYVGIVLGVLGMGMAGAAVLKAMLLK